MIYLIYGTDETKSRVKYDSLIASLQAKNPEASLFRLTSDNFKINDFEELTRGQGLFYQKFIVGCDNLFSRIDKPELIDELKNFIVTASTSDNVFIFLENELEGEILEKIKKLATKAQEINKTVFSEKIGFNIFSITDAFSARNKERAWALYEEALLTGISAEEILWKLIWQVNNLLLVKNTKDATKLKMKPYPLTKAKNAAKSFTNEELKKLSAGLVDLYHNNFLGTDEFEFGLEKILLSI